MNRLSAALLAFLVIGCWTQARAEQPALEVVKRFPSDFSMIGVGVDKQGDVFASAPATMKRYNGSVVRVDRKTGALVPFPNADWNHFTPDPQGRDEWVLVPALRVDDDNHLWVRDSSLPSIDQKKLPPKLVEFDATTGKLIRQYVFDKIIVPADSLNDMRVDTKTQYAYITNEWGRDGLVALDLRTGAYRLVLDNTRSGVADPGQHLHIWGELALKKNDELTVTQDDGIAMSPDRAWVYYRPLTDHNHWRIPAESLRDASLSRADLEKKVEFLNQSVLSGGIEMDSCNRLWVGDIENHALYRLDLLPGNKSFRTTRVIDQPELMDWADGFAISNGWLYISDSRLDQIIFKNSHPQTAPSTIFRMRLPRCGQ